jgi:hypothetical protein
MITFTIHPAPNTPADADAFVWRARYGNMRWFQRDDDPAKLRNTVNHIMTVARHLERGGAFIDLSKAAEARRQLLGLPRFLKPNYRGGR